MYTGTVCAADDWDGDHEYKTVKPSLPDSLGSLLHTLCDRADMPSFGLDLRNPTVKELCSARMLQVIFILFLSDGDDEHTSTITTNSQCIL
jgi:erythromycin esterase-like protein